MECATVAIQFLPSQLKMFTSLRTLLFCLAAMAMGTVQLFGVQAGYFCGCTGQQNVQPKCEPEACHPQNQKIGEDSAQSDCALVGNDQSPIDHDHKEIRDDLDVTSFTPVQSLPALVLYFVPPAFQMPDCTMLSLVCAPAQERPEIPEYGNPPMPQLVARTIVMLV